MIKINETPEKLNPRKRNIQLKNISLHDLHLIDTDTGENITQEVIDAYQKEQKQLTSRLVLNFQKKNKLGGG